MHWHGWQLCLMMIRALGTTLQHKGICLLANFQGPTKAEPLKDMVEARPTAASCFSAEPGYEFVCPLFTTATALLQSQSTGLASQSSSLCGASRPTLGLGCAVSSSQKPRLLSGLHASACLIPAPFPRMQLTLWRVYHVAACCPHGLPPMFYMTYLR